MHVVIVGAGLGGLSAACRLSGAGHKVTVVERETFPGGRAGVKLEHGYTMDTGPTVLTMRGLLAETFATAGSDMADMLRLTPLDPMYRATFPDGSTIYARRGIEAMTHEIREKAGPKDAEGFERFCMWLTKLYELEMPNFIDRNFDGAASMLNPLTPLLKLAGLGGFRRLSSVVNGYFEDDRLQRLFSFQAMYAGLSPFTALALYSIITYMDSVEGVWFPEGGMHSVPQALALAAEKAGTDFVYGTSVQKLIRKSANTRVSGVGLDDGRSINADAVILNLDLPVAYRELLPDLDAPAAARNGTYSPSCLIWLAGVRGELPAQTEHHNIHFGGHWREAFDALLKDGRPMPDPSILVTSPTVTDPTLAPPNRHSLYALEPMPNLDGNINWKREGQAIRQRLLTQVATLGYPMDIEVEEMIGPQEWQERGMERGTPFALSHKFTQTGPFRPANTDKRVQGLVFAGSGTTPGVGIPMVLISGKLAAQRIAQLS